MSNTINSNLLLSSMQQKKEREGGKDVLGKDDFMKILMTQLQNQDPLNPMQDKDFIAQMATFSTLEQITNLGESMEKFIEAEGQNNLISYNQFVGKEITWHKLESSNSEDSKTDIKEGKGIINSVRFKDNEVQFILEDGTTLAPGNVSQVNQYANTSGGNSLVTASGLIGRTVHWKAGETELHSAVTSVSTKEGSLWFHLENGSRINEGQILKIE
ncbi:flagellar hook assembly protein FlgD [Rossellomorea vietnamensis]|uniref:Basal-body rod modification protein FlgD n=1 Tax=Rossellomorea vietnamensis TaxID=218284 RepID=A0A5D4KJV2_9BACI|nr:flagellar hook assembly protein FlgD [Rossellomorea vietnamensis]TYR77522.1 flagellar hook assembly protein FlgD [Rossellomorea vietnamensis]